MKNILFGIFAAAVLLLAACNSKEEKPAEISTSESYIDVQVGSVYSGQYKVLNLERIKKEWEKQLSTTAPLSLNNFKIVQGTTTGDAQEQYYILTATSKDGSKKVASLLSLKGDDFYFDTQDQDSYRLIVCESVCESGCDPVAASYNGTRYLNCSPCTDCRKQESEMR